MAIWAVTNTFANSTTADATQVNTNFTDLINCSSDGTKDMSISALTCGGALTVNNSVTLGSASNHDLTLNASLASSIAIKTTNSYDIGGSTFAMRSLYLASSDSAAKATRIIGATVASNWTLTLPTAVPTYANSKFIATTGGVSSWAANSAWPGITGSKTSNYNATPADDLIPCDTSSAFTVTLPAANISTGVVIRIIKTTSDTNALTIARAGSDTINGATSTSINTQYEIIELVSDGSSAWYIARRDYPRVWTSYSLTIGGSTSAPTKANSPVYDQAFWRRVGDSMEITYNYSHTNNTGAANGTGSYLFPIPSGWTIDSSKIQTTGNAMVGSNRIVTGVAYEGAVTVADTGNLYLDNGNDSSAFAILSSTWNALGNASVTYSLIACVPITGWK